MALSSDETYVQTYQKYLKHKDNSEDLRKVTSSQTASTKVLKPVLADKDCKICRVLAKPGDLCRVLNQGLYHKYTSSQDYFYTRDINTLLSKKRKAFSVRYYDDLIYDECKERLKGYFKKKDSVSLMHEIKQFYTKFKNFPRNFHTSFFHIINSNIRKHRRIEYMRVFHGANLEDDKNPEENQADQRDNSKNGKLDKEFNLMELLGDSFVQENYKDISNFALNGVRADKPIDTARSIKEIEENFRALWKAPETIVNDPNSAAFSNALYNKNYMLYSRSDSQNAEDILKQIVNEFGEVGNKASMSLAEKVLHQVASTATRKQEHRISPAINQRDSGSGFEFTPLLQASKKSMGSTSTANFHVMANNQPQPMVRQPSSSNINTSNRVQSNPRAHSRGEVDSANILGKVNQSKLYEQRKSSEKFSVEHLNDIVINRNKILSNLYQFRSTRSKSGGLKSIGSTSKTPSHKGGFALGVVGDMVDPQDFRQPHAPVHYIHEKSQSPSPDRRISTGDSRHMPEMMARPKPSIEISTQSTMKRSASQGLNGELREASSPMISQVTQIIQHKKANSVMKKRVTATPMRQGVNPAMQTFTMHTMGNSSIHNMSNSHSHQDTVSPNHGKFINPMRSSLGGTQQYYFRHQSPMDEKMHISGVYQKGVNGASEPMIKNLNIRGMKHTSPNRTDNNYRTNTLSTSGRHQNLLDASGQLNKTNPDQMKVKKIEKANMQAFAAKIIKRASLAPNNIIAPVIEHDEQEMRPKKTLELSDSNYNGFKMSSKEHTPLNIGPSSTSSLNKYKVEVKKNTWSSYNLKGGARDSNIRLTIKK